MNPIEHIWQVPSPSSIVDRYSPSTSKTHRLRSRKTYPDYFASCGECHRPDDVTYKDQVKNLLILVREESSFTMVSLKTQVKFDEIQELINQAIEGGEGSVEVKL